MTISTDTWQTRAAICELLALSFRYPDDLMLAKAIASGEWEEAAVEITEALGLDWRTTTVLGDIKATDLPNPDDIQNELRPEATRLFVSTPEATCSPYEGVWRAREEGTKPLFFVNPYSIAVERFCRACGLGHPKNTNEPLDAVWTELELLEYLALRAADDAKDNIKDDADLISDGMVASADLPGGSPEAAWNEFIVNHAKLWMPTFATAVQQNSRIPFYRQAASLLTSFIS